MNTSGKHTYEFKSNLTPDELLARLENHTQKSKNLVTIITDRDFIGGIDGHTFKIISSPTTARFGVLCVIEGIVTPTSEVVMTTSVHKFLRILLLSFGAIFMILLITLYLATPMDTQSFISSLIVVPFGLVIIGSWFSYIRYPQVRDKAIAQLKTILNLK